MTLNIIHLPRRLDRYISLVDQLISQNIHEYKIWQGVENENVWTGISQAFKQIVMDAKEKELPFVCIGEDDLQFTDKDSWKYFNENTPDYYDMYIASYYSGLETFDHRIESFRGMTLIKVAQKFYNTFLSLPEDKNIDNALDYKGEYFVSPKMCCLQIPGYSDQMKKVVDYTNKIPEHKIFRGYAT